MSNKTFSLFILMWIAWLFIAIDLIEIGHWLSALVMTVVIYASTFLNLD